MRWFALTPDEKRSSELGAFRAPFTLAATFGGGIAEQIGFAIGRYMRVVCPMEAFSHRLALHVDAAGNYALLRDNALVAPTEFDGPHYPPLRLPTFVKPQLSLWNIDGSIFTQNVLLWEGEHAPPGPQTQPKYSIIIVSIRFTRRLQAVLRSLVHQRDFDPARLEIIIAYITGMDATDDLISSFELAHPGLRIVRSPFPERYAKSKGFVINESVGLTRGAWVMILDSDILLPPDFLHRLDTLPGTPPFVAPDRRKMLTPESTARILIGEIAPWEHWDELLEGPGELRVQEARLPIGFCQCVRRDCFDTVRYLEYDHFAGADWDFIVEVEQKFGEGKWLENVAVLHLDHGGSQWYGVQKHL